ncbi:FAD:protein FMN transferase [Streptomyces odontomachi]|uniref:FAD:protein FMN transferase n=1 Tax=Streptomyces odontomachi TaxID=2944940 RepID=UPI0035A8EE3A
MAEGVALHRTVHTMGTVFSLTARGSTVDPAALDAAEAWLHHVDATFSPYRPHSEVSRLARGELTAEACSPEVTEVLGLCTRAEERTGGWFSTHYSGSFDPTGLVKGWAVERAARLLLAGGARDVCVNGGGDIQLYGGPWRVGVTDPLRPGRLVAVVAHHAGPLAIATSGPAERGCHIVDPHTGAPVPDGLASLTVLSAHLTDADAWATAAYAMGAEARSWLARQPGVRALAVRPDGSTWETCAPAAPTAARSRAHG